MSERRGCAVAGQHRTTQRYRAKPKDDEVRLVAEMHQQAKKFPRFGYRRITVLLRKEGWAVNHKRVSRLWRLEGLKIVKQAKKRRRMGHSANSCTRRKAEHRNHVWAYDFTTDRTEDGRRLKFLGITDEFTRECLYFHPDRQVKADNVVQVLDRLINERGAPRYIRSDNGPEFIAAALRSHLRTRSISTLFIAPGSPWENAYAESFFSKARDEFLDMEIFTSLVEAQYLAREYRKTYNEHRPHSSLGYRTPAQFARELDGTKNAGRVLKAAFAATANGRLAGGLLLAPKGQQAHRVLVG